MAGYCAGCNVLNSSLIYFNAIRHHNESVYYTIANLEEAVITVV